MKYAITCVNQEVFQHFGKCPSFLLVDIENQQVQRQEMLDANGSGHGALAALLANANVQILVCGGIGEGAKSALSNANIEIIGGAKGNIEDILAQLCAGTLHDDPSGACTHHHGKHICSN